MPHYYEDLDVGATFETAGVTLTEDCIIRFGIEYDFQPFHIDKHAAKASIFGSLIASGLQTLVLSLRQCNQAALFSQAIAGLGFQDVRFLQPVPPGTTLRVKVRVVGRRLAKSRKNAGVVNWDLSTFDQDDRIVLTMRIANLVKCRPPGSPATEGTACSGTRRL